MIDLEVKHNIGYVQNLFNEMAGDTDQLLDDILRTAANYEVRSTKKRFSDQMGPDAEPWKPLSQLTVRARRQGRGGGGRGHKRLQGSGALRQSIVPERTSQNEVRIVSNKPYAKWQQKGFRSRITGKQAWWMVIHLYGYDPKKPEKFGKEAFAKGAKGLGKKANKQVLRWYGYSMARAIWRGLVGRWLVIPPSPFMGFSTEDIEEIDRIAERRTVRFIEMHTRRGALG